MRILIDRESEVPLYEQIEGFLRQAILSGGLAPETRLPSTRHLARDLGVNRITVENAYAGLEAEGLAASRAGSGTYVLPQVSLPPLPQKGAGEDWPLWQQEIRARGKIIDRPDVGKCLRGGGHASPVDLSGGSGDSRLFPVEDYRRVIHAVLHRDGMEALGYGEPQGYTPLRGTIAQILTTQGIPAQAENVLITAGSQQAIALVTQLLLEPGDTILVESPTYAVALDLFRDMRLKLVGVPVDGQGMQADLLEKLIQQHRPGMIYTIPNFHNPTGVCLSLARRRQLIALADRYNLPILEDDYVGDLRYEGRTLPALKSLDPGGRVIYASTFSKMLMPGLRVGFLMADGPIYSALVDHKRVSDLTSSNLHQRALEAYVTVGRYQVHLRRSSHLYHKRRDAMMDAINRYLPMTAQAAAPQGGLFIWLRLPEPLTALPLLPLACEEGVGFAPGEYFFTDRADGPAYIRLNFASHPPDLIEEGIRRLGKAMKRLAEMRM